MSDERINEQLILNTLRQVLKENPGLVSSISKADGNGGKDQTCSRPSDVEDGCLPDIFDIPEQEDYTVDDPKDKEAFMRLKRRTIALVGIGKIKDSPRDKTSTLLRRYALLSAGIDAVRVPVSQKLLDWLGCPLVKTKPKDIDEYLTNPVLSREIDDENLEIIRTKLKKNPDVQIIFGESNSGIALEVGLPDYWPVLKKGLEDAGIDYGTPVFLRYPRLGSGDLVAQEVGAKCCVMILGDRTCMSSCESMSAYITYNAHVGILENKRTIVSQIYKDGTPYIEAAAYTVDVIKRVLREKKSGVELESGVSL